MALRPALNLYNPRGHVISAEPASEPVTAAELRDHLNYGESELSDAQANAWITAARSLIEENTGLALITQSWTMALDRWPSSNEPWWDGVRQGSITELHGAYSELKLPRFPLQSVDSVTTYDTAGASTAVTVANVFDVDVYQKPGRMALKSGQTWPTALRPTNAIVIVYTAGYGDAAADVPAPLKLAVKMVAGYLESHRGDECTPADAMGAAGAILDQYRVARL